MGRKTSVPARMGKAAGDFRDISESGGLFRFLVRRGEVEFAQLLRLPSAPTRRKGQSRFRGPWGWPAVWDENEMRADSP